MKPIAILFPGQGSQHVGMGQAAHEASEIARASFAEADEALGMPLSELCFAGEEAELARTEITQPAILTVSVALWRMLAQRGVSADFMAGHSLGEYSALVAAGSFDLATGARLVHQRGRFMQEAVAPDVGAMAALLGLDDDAVEGVCTEVRGTGVGVVEPANYNSPGQVVIAGHRDAVAAAVELAKERGARRAMLLNVSAPFHCSLMAPAQDRLAVELNELEIAAPTAPVICNVGAVPLTEPEAIRTALRDQVTAPVRWVEGLRALAAAGVETFVEVGPGKVLSGLTRRTLDDVTVFSVQGPDDVDTVARTLVGEAGQAAL